MSNTTRDLSWKVERDGRFSLWENDLPVLVAHARARDERGIIVDTRRVPLLEVKYSDAGATLLFEGEQGLMLREELRVEGQSAYARCVLLDRRGADVESNDLVPLVMCGLNDDSPYLWRCLQSKMLQVPYDQDMWPRPEAVAMRPGRGSADYSVLFHEQTREGILIGAVEFDAWKNAIACSGFDCRTLEARSGNEACGDNTHDLLDHATMVGPEVASSEFVVMYGSDWRLLMERYGDELASRITRRQWPGGAPFGYNTFAALCCDITEDNYRACGTFIREALIPRGFENDGTTFIDLDGGWRDFDREAMLRVKDEHLAAGQRVGIYDSPFAYWGGDLDAEIPYLDEPHTFREIVVRGKDGEPLPPLDTAYAYDVTHPVWQEWTRRKAQFYIDWGFDLVKFDFLSHAGLEGVRLDPTVRTGRQALKVAYDFLADVYDERRIGRPFYLSISISPVVPVGPFNTRRISCDAFGLAEDIEYVCNALTYGWWTCGRLYQHNDADHVVLYKSFGMMRESTEGEARARYTTAAIAGSTMLLSDDYDVSDARERTLRIATNEAVNHVARSGVAFRPMDSAGGSGCHVFSGVMDGVPHVALFSWAGVPERIEAPCERIGVPRGTYEDLWSGMRVSTQGNMLGWDFSDSDAVLLRLVD